MLPIALALAQLAPSLIGMLAGPKAEQVANQAVEIAKVVTGKDTGDEALQVLRSDPAKALEYQVRVIDAQVEMHRIDAELMKKEIDAATQNAGDVNKTMQAEAAAEHWPTYSWRPFIGFAFGINVVASSVLVIGTYAAQVAGLPGAAVALANLPGTLAALAGISATAAPILGIASWFRGRMQTDPNIPTINKG
jgi:hypothetical protein